MRTELRPKLVKILKELKPEEREEMLLILKEGLESNPTKILIGGSKYCPPDIDANGSYGNAVHILEGD
jgi:hypothetical protein